MFVLAALLMTAAGFATWRYLPFLWRPIAPPTATAKMVPFTTFSGSADQPAFSPNGDQIAFAWNGPAGGDLDIYIKLIGAGSPLRLTTDPAEDISPAWSPDGRYLAFIRRTEVENGIFIVPALGGAERKLGRTEPTISTQAWPDCRLSWSPDGEFLAVVDRGSAQERLGIYAVSVDDGEKQRLTSPPESAADTAPAYSPDGRALAFVRNASFNTGDIYVTNLTGGEPRRVTTDGQRVHSLAWTADGSEIIFSSNRGGGFGLWRIPVSGGQPEPVAGTGQNTYSPAISPKGDKLVYNVSVLDADIFRIGGLAAGALKTPETKLIFSTRQDHSPQYSPDGKRIVFVSDRSGSEEIWVCEANGSSPVQLTFFNGPSVGTPHWSPDSRQIIFDARPNGNADIFAVNADGGKPRPLISDPSHDVMASWSRDGNWIYFCSNRSGDFQIWKAPSGGGEAFQVTKQGGFEAFEAPDGQLLYYTKARGPGSIWQVPVTGGEEKQVSEQLSIDYWRYWAVADNGIYFASAPLADRASEIDLYSFATHRVSRISTLERGPLLGLPGMTVSPDRRSILLAQPGQTLSNIMLIENFR
jgi:Tol biopolymer transport system component